MLKLIDKIRKPLILFPLTLCLTLFLSLPWVSAKQPPKPQPQSWQIDGIMAAIDDSYPQVKGYAFDKLAEYEAQDLKAVLKKPEDIALKFVNILSDEKVEPGIRSRAALALSKLGEAGAKYAPDILNLGTPQGNLKSLKLRFSIAGRQSLPTLVPSLRLGTRIPRLRLLLKLVQDLS